MLPELRISSKEVCTHIISTLIRNLKTDDSLLEANSRLSSTTARLLLANSILKKYMYRRCKNYQSTNSANNHKCWIHNKTNNTTKKTNKLKKKKLTFSARNKVYLYAKQNSPKDALIRIYQVKMKA